MFIQAIVYPNNLKEREMPSNPLALLPETLEEKEEKGVSGPISAE